MPPGKLLLDTVGMPQESRWQKTNLLCHSSLEERVTCSRLGRLSQEHSSLIAFSINCSSTVAGTLSILIGVLYLLLKSKPWRHCQNYLEKLDLPINYTKNLALKKKYTQKLHHLSNAGRINRSNKYFLRQSMLKKLVKSTTKGRTSCT